MTTHPGRGTVRTVVQILGLALVMLALSSCRDYGPAVCDPSEMPAPILAGPGGEADPLFGRNDTLTPTLHWIYTGECLPSRFRIQVSIYPSALYLTVNEEVTPVIGPTLVGEGGEAGHTFAWAVPEPLEPGTDYYWRVTPYSGVFPGEPSVWAGFLTPPWCSGAGRTLSPPQPAFPANGTTVASHDPRFMWSDPTPCALIGGSYNLQVSTSPTFTPDTTTTLDEFGSGTYYAGYLALSYCTHYYWRVRFVSVEPTIPPGPYSDVWHFYTPEIPESGGCAIPTPASPAGEAPPLDAAPEGMAREDASCRVGPSTQFNIAAYLVQGQVVPITGRLSQGGWWQVQPPDIQGPCWVAEDVVEPYGDLGKIPVAVPPELPTDEPTNVPPTGCWCPDPMQNNKCVYTVPCPAYCKACTP